MSKYLSKEVMWCIIHILSGDREVKTKCSSCNKPHSGKCTKPKNAAAQHQGGIKLCPVCEKSAHNYKTKAGGEGISKHVKGCPAFKLTSDDKRHDMVKKVKSKLPICLQDRSLQMEAELYLIISHQVVLFYVSPGYPYKELLYQGLCHV